MMVYLKKNIKSRIKNGHPWVYDNEIEAIADNPAPGDIVNVYQGNRFIGKGFYNPHSAITVRILTRKNEQIDPSFFTDRLHKALRYRMAVVTGESAFRVVYGEADGLPGLIVDKFADYVVMQVNTLGMDKWRSSIIESIMHILTPKDIFEKDDDPCARKEQFIPHRGWIHGIGPELIPFAINGIHFLADTLGQKTGFFLDQRINAAVTGRYAAGKKVLDAFSYTGNFGMHALHGNARLVIFIDSSPRSLAVLQETLALNRINPSRYVIVHADCFDYLHHSHKSREKYDLVIIDPPSFAKVRGAKQNALKGYRELNVRAMKLLKSEGLLSTSSCTHVVYEEEFRKLLYNAAENSGRQVSIIYRGMQPPDHPVVLQIFETEYLHHYLLYIVDANPKQ